MENSVLKSAVVKQQNCRHIAAGRCVLLYEGEPRMWAGVEECWCWAVIHHAVMLRHASKYLSSNSSHNSRQQQPQQTTAATAAASLSASLCRSCGWRGGEAGQRVVLSWSRCQAVISIIIIIIVISSVWPPATS